MSITDLKNSLTDETAFVNTIVPADELVIGFYGKMGSGKTLNMTKWGILLSEVTNRPIYANYHIFHPNAHFFRDFTDIWQTVNNAIILWDEIGQDHDSRNSRRTDFTAKRQNDFTYWFLQSRKRLCSFFYTTQRVNMVEKRIRENTQYLFHEIKDNYFNIIYETLYNCEEFGFEAVEKVNEFVTEKPQLLYGYYNTHEITRESFFNA